MTNQHITTNRTPDMHGISATIKVVSTNGAVDSYTINGALHLTKGAAGVSLMKALPWLSSKAATQMLEAATAWHAACAVSDCEALG